MRIHELAGVPRVTAGAGAHRQVGPIAAALAGDVQNAFLVVDPGLAATGLVEEVRTSLAKAGLAVILFTDLKSDPTIAQADRAAAAAREARASIVVSVGGGSALDLGKAVAAIAPDPRSALAYELGRAPLPQRPLAKICVPTTSGTGSETTRTAILTRADHAKVWLWGDALKADEVVLDPEFTVSLPAHLTAATGIDAFVHAVEAATNRNANPFGDIFAHEAIRLVAGHLSRAVEHPRDLAARAVMQRAATFAGIAIDNCGTAIAHAIGHAMGSLRPIHHGRAVGIAMLASLPWSIEDNEDRFAACALAMGADPEASAFVAAYEKLLRSIGLKVAIADEFAGISPEILAAQAARPENAAMRAANRRAVSEADLLAFADNVLSVA
ncbi:MAG: iron-containing alcohol dehydrogenase [Methylobacteriaceae bacterium]|nr:iron-containing alcohol dehydrogenase [Methylobacteriaceae bacterium]MBV9701164.1 iron-containing alcohol dehydrogenase [Methylobacteriaceae bacterium]